LDKQELSSWPGSLRFSFCGGQSASPPKRQNIGILCFEFYTVGRHKNHKFICIFYCFIF
jgi:hypothetical protein